MKQDGAISTLNGKPLKLVDYITYFESTISSTESNVNVHKGKAWTATDNLLTTRNFDLSNKIKLELNTS